MEGPVMVDRDIQKLLGGYATGTLTEAERRRLFEFAMHDQELFDALTDEQALKEILDDPQCRQRLLRALKLREQQPAGHLLGALVQWLRHPANLATTGGLVAGILAVWILIAVQKEPAVTPLEEEQSARLLETREDTETTPLHETAKDLIRSSDVGQKVERADEVVLEKSVSSGHPRDQLASRASPAAPEPAVRRDRKMAPASAPSVATGASVLQGQPRWLTSHNRPVKAGPARHWFYGRVAPASMMKGRRQPEPLQQKGPEEAAGPAIPPVGMGGARTAGAVKPLGLRFSVEKQDQKNEFIETNPEGPFQPSDALRLTLEANEPGFLYVFRLEPRGEWRWISHSGAGDKEGKGSGVEVLSGIRYIIPGTGVLPLYGTATVNKMMVIYSRQPRPELQVFDPAVRELEQRDDGPSADLESLLSRARIETSARPLFVEPVQPDTPKGSQERAVYIVNPEATREAVIAVELTLPSGERPSE